MRRLLAALMLVGLFGGGAWFWYNLPSQLERALKSAVDSKWPPVKPEENQAAAIARAAYDLRRLERPDVYAGISASQLSRDVGRLLTEKVKGLSEATLTLGKQDVVVRGHFDLSLEKEQVRLVGEAEVHATCYMRDKSLFFRPSLSGVTLRRVYYKGSSTADALLPAVNSTLTSLLNNINGAMQATRVGIDWSLFQPFDPVKTLAGVQNVVEVVGKPILFLWGIGHAGVLIDTDGLHVVADVIPLTPERVARVLPTLAARPAEFSKLPPTSEELAVISACAHPPEGIDQTVKDAQASCQAAEAGLLNASKSQPDTSQPTSFDEYRTDFLAKTAVLGTQADIGWATTSAALSSNAIATTVNEFLQAPAISLHLRFPSIAVPFKQEIKTEPPPDLNCGNQRGCPSVFEYPPYNPRGCGGPPWEKIPCEVAKAAEKVGYETAKATAEAGWSAAKADCERLKVTERLGCEINQTWLNGVSNMPLGEVKGVVNADGGEVAIALHSVKLGPGLDTASVTLSVGARADVGADINWVAYNLGNIACQPQWSGRVKAVASAFKPAWTVNTAVKPSRDASGSLALTVTTAADSIALKLTPSPFAALVAQNPTLMLTCPAVGIANATASVSPHLREELYQDTFDIPLPQQTMPIELKPLLFDVGGSTLKVVPEWRGRVVVFSAGS